MTLAPAVSVPAPVVGSARYFMLLYTPRERRRTLMTLLALTDEIAAGMARQLDQSVAQVRLAWWHEEAQRCARGAATHPWLIGWSQASGAHLDLVPLVQAAVADLADGASGTAEERLPRERFVLAAAALGAASLSRAHQQRLGELGHCVEQLERLAARGPAPAQPASGSDALQALRQLQRTGPLIESVYQPVLAPLLVWSALAMRQAERRCRRAAARSASMTSARFDGFADNLAAWRAAQRAARGRFRLMRQ